MTITKAPTPTPTVGGGISQDENNAATDFNSTAGTDSGTDRVWMPGASTIPKGLSAGNLPPSAQQFVQGGWMSLDEATASYYLWTPKQRDDFRAKALVGGLLQKGDGDLEAGALWAKLAKQASFYGAQSNPVSPMDLLAGYVKSNSNGNNWVKQGDFEVNPLTGERRYVGPQFKTTTAAATNLTDPATARAIATQLFQQLLGRDPGPGEVSNFATALSQSEIQNPSQTTTTTQYDMTTGDATNTSSVNVGGMTDQGRAELAQDQIKKKPEYANVQAATTYMNALNQAVGV